MKDELIVKFSAGRGGDGSPAVRSLRPFGGDGGQGGDFILEGTSHRYDLSFIDPKRDYRGADGATGKTHGRRGEDAKPFILKVPLVTEVYDLQGNQIAKVTKNGQQVTLLKGGNGGYGNMTLHKNKDLLEPGAIRGKPGEAKRFKLVMSLQSDVIFIGFPNAGKSSLLNAITNAHSKVAAYEFTTLSPHLGVADDLILMDLPGLIEGTYQGRGLGAGFMKHVRSARLVAHFISVENDDLLQAYTRMRMELANLGPDISNLDEVIVITKTDLVDEEKLLEIEETIKTLNKPYVLTSSADQNYSADVVEFFRMHI